MITRRSLVRGSAVTLASAMGARAVRGMPLQRFQGLPEPQDARLKHLVETAVGAAMSAGASYADTRLSFTQQMGMKVDWRPVSGSHGGGEMPGRSEILSFGVRAIVDGYWGFASSPVWGPQEAARLGRSAVEQAKTNLGGQPRMMEMAPASATKQGDWSMVVQEDPFEMASEEIFDYLRGLSDYISHLKQTGSWTTSGMFMRQHKAFGNSDGQFVTQRLYRTEGDVTIQAAGKGAMSPVRGRINRLTIAGMGFEYFRNQPLRTYVDELREDLIQESLLPVVPLDVGRYPVLMDACGVADLAGQSIGAATEIDRVMGYEANAGGTSYITDPEAMLGTLQIGAPLLHLSGSRSTPGTVAHVRWDDDGVEPRDFPIVKDGRLVNLQTHREGCGWIKPHYAKTGQPFASFGCAHTPDAIDVPLVQTANLTVHADDTAQNTLDTLRSEIDRGVEWKWPSGGMDFQQSTGLFMGGTIYEIKQGKRVARFAGGGMIFRTSELWGNLQRLGGRESVLRVGQQQYAKGEPWRSSYFSVDAPPAVFKEMSIIDPTRKA